jgi:di/tricarboxylate transporter
MRTDQMLIVALIGVMMAAFVWGRYRYDLVGAGALVIALILGLVSPKDAFSGFADDIVIIVACALIVSAAISRSGVMDLAMRRLHPELRGPRTQLLILVFICAALSAFVKNIGALAIMIPVAVQLARKASVSASLFLMPMSFASLLGGLMTQIGTSPNIIVSRVRQEMTGQAFSMFDYTPVGAALTAVGLIFLVTCYKLLPVRTRETASLEDAVKIDNYTTEATVGVESTAIGQPVSNLLKLAGGAAVITAIIGSNGKRRTPLPDMLMKAGDVLILEGEQEALDTIVSHGSLSLREHHAGQRAEGIEHSAVEAIVGERSRLVGLSAKDISLFNVSGLNLLAVSRRGKRFVERLGEIKIQDGDIVLLQGQLNELPELLREWDCLPLVAREVKLGMTRNALLPVGILLVAMAATAFGGVPVAAAFFAAALLIILTGSLPLREAYNALDAPILVMLAVLIPISDALRKTGTTDVIAAQLSSTAQVLPAYGAIALILLAAMAVTPFLNKAATVLVMAPIAATFATQLGYRPEAFLMAVAIGAGCDFLTPIGHQCNTLVMGPGGYRFGDYWRLGLPLSLLVVAVSVPMLMVVWPL